MAAFIKCVKQHSYPVDLTELEVVAERYQSAKNYFYARYSGIKSITLLSSYKKDIRDRLIKEGTCDMFKLPARFWKICLDEVISNIKSMWSNTKERIKVAIRANANLTEDDKKYLYYILKADSLYQAILLRNYFKEPDKLAEIELTKERKKYLFNLLRRYTYKYKNEIPKSTNLRSIQLDADMYNYLYEPDGLYIEIMTTVPRKRVKVRLKGHYRYKGNLTLLLNRSDSTIHIHKGLTITPKTFEGSENIIGIDKGYTVMLTCSNGKEYGTALGKMLATETERLKEVNVKRNRLYALARMCTEKGDYEKAKRILENNLGHKKYDNKKYHTKEKIRSYVNHEINRFLKEDNPSMVVKEELTFVSTPKDRDKQYNRKMSSWIKGYIDERIEYKLAYQGVQAKNINPAYTSQTCYKCGQFGTRTLKIFTCPTCGIMDADHNASKNILARKEDKEIGLHTPYKTVKAILETRYKESLSINE